MKAIKTIPVKIDGEIYQINETDYDAKIHKLVSETPVEPDLESEVVELPEEINKDTIGELNKDQLKELAIQYQVSVPLSANKGKMVEMITEALFSEDKGE